MISVLQYSRKSFYQMYDFANIIMIQYIAYPFLYECGGFHGGGGLASPAPRPAPYTTPAHGPTPGQMCGLNRGGGSRIHSGLGPLGEVGHGSFGKGSLIS